MSHLYITDNGSILSVKGGRFFVNQKNNLIKSIPKESVESITIFGNSSITTPCIHTILQLDIPVCYFSSRGKYYGKLQSQSNQDISLIKKQIQAFEKDIIYLELAKKVIMAKIHNQTIVLRRYLKKDIKHEEDIIII